MVKPITILDHEAEGERNFLSQYEGATLFKAFVGSFTAEINQIETQLNLFLNETGLQTADGAQLNGIGRILNAKTRPPDDELFRVLLNALTAAYNSEGTAQDVRAVILLTVNASSVTIDEIGGGVFALTIFQPVFKFGQEVVFDVVNLAKAAGIEFASFVISDSFSDPTFSFVGDNRPNSEGFAVAVPPQIPDSYYLFYVFPNAGSVTTTNRVWLTSSSGDVEQDLVVNFATSNANTNWFNELLLSYAVVGGRFEWVNRDPFQSKIKLTVIDAIDAYSMTVNGNWQHHQFVVRAAGVTKAVIQIDSTPETPTVLNAEFVAYTDAHAATWALNNPSGLGKTFVESTGDFSEEYGTSGGGRYSLAI